MEKIRNSLLITMFLLVISITFNVKAESFDYYLSSGDQNYEYINKDSTKTKNIKRGDIVTITVIVDNKENVTDYQLNSGKLTIRWDEKYLSLEMINGKYYDDSITDITGLTLGSINNSYNKLSIQEISSTGSLKAGKNKIVALKFKVLDTASSGETKIYQMDGEDNLKCLYTKEERTVNCGESLYSEIKLNLEKSTINKLASLKINGQELEFFDENTNDYELTVEPSVERAKIEVTKKDSRSTISGNYGDNPLQYGVNKFVINVISESGARNTYNIKINREDSRSDDNTLKTLTLSSGEINFKPEVDDYNITVENDVETLTITSSLSDSKAKYVTDFKNKEITLNEGSNKIEIKVVSEKGNERVYTLNINRLLSSNNSLKSLKVNDEKIDLKENEFIYNLSVENEVDEVIIKAEPNDIKATVELDERYPLEVGENEISIIVVAASGSKASYTLNITREKILSKDSLLSSLKIEGYDIGFKSSKTLYDLHIDDNVSELKITTTTEDPTATVEIEGNKDLENGSIIKINVRAEDGSFTRYFINIAKGSEGMSPVIIIIIVLLLLLAGCIGLIFYRKKRKEKKDFDKFDEKSIPSDEASKEENDIDSNDYESKEEVTPEESIPVGKNNTLENNPIEKESINTEEDNVPIKNSESTNAQSELNYDEDYARHVKKELEIDEQNKDVE